LGDGAIFNFHNIAISARQFRTRMVAMVETAKVLCQMLVKIISFFAEFLSDWVEY